MKFFSWENVWIRLLYLHKVWYADVSRFHGTPLLLCMSLWFPKCKLTWMGLCSSQPRWPWILLTPAFLVGHTLFRLLSWAGDEVAEMRKSWCEAEQVSSAPESLRAVAWGRFSHESPGNSRETSEKRVLYARGWWHKRDFQCLVCQGLSSFPKNHFDFSPWILFWKDWI